MGTKQKALYLIEDGPILAASNAIWDDHQAYMDKVDAFAEKFGAKTKILAPNSGYFSLQWENDEEPMPRRMWRVDNWKQGFTPSLHNKDADAEWRDIVKSKRDQQSRLLEQGVPASALERVRYNGNWSCEALGVEVFMSGARVLHQTFSGELGDDPPYDPPGCRRISEIEYGKICKADREVENG